MSLEHTVASLEFPLGVGIFAPSALEARDLELVVTQPWCHPLRIVRVVVGLPTKNMPITPSDLGVAIQSLISQMISKATLQVPCVPTTHTNSRENDVPLTHRLNAAMRDASADPTGRYGRCGCVLVEIPVPVGITLRPGAAIFLSISIAGSSLTLRIPATGISHVHSAACNHKKMCPGAVLHAAQAGDVAALETALAGGGSTEETDEVIGGRVQGTMRKFSSSSCSVPLRAAQSICCVVGHI